MCPPSYSDSANVSACFIGRPILVQTELGGELRANGRTSRIDDESIAIDRTTPFPPSGYGDRKQEDGRTPTIPGVQDCRFAEIYRFRATLDALNLAGIEFSKKRCPGLHRRLRILAALPSIHRPILRPRLPPASSARPSQRLSSNP